MSRLRNWCFTLNNWTEEEFDNVRLLGLSDRVRFLVCGKETGEQGTPHLQGYVEFRDSVRLGGVRKAFGGAERAHWEGRRGTPTEAAAYCRKERDWWASNDSGVPESSQGKRSDLEDACSLIRDGASTKRLAEEHPATFVRYFRGLERFGDIVNGRRERAGPPLVLWLYGAPGAGKSRTAFEAAKDAYIKQGGHKWWDGYERQHTVIMDDWRANSMEFNELLTVIDRYPKQVEVKGGTRWLEAHRFIITSVKQPCDEYSGTGEDMSQLYRRITKTIEVKEFTEDLVNEIKNL